MKTESKVHKGLLSSVCVSIATFLAPALSLAQESLVAGDAFTEEIVVTAQARTGKYPRRAYRYGFLFSQRH